MMGPWSHRPKLRSLRGTAASHDVVMGDDRASTSAGGRDVGATWGEQIASAPAASNHPVGEHSLYSAPAPAPAAGGVLLYKVADAARLLNISRTLIFEQLRTGRLASVKQGRIRLIPATALLDYVELLVEESREAV